MIIYNRIQLTSACLHVLFQSAGAHPVLGIIVLILALLQPLMALIRPDPKDDK